MNSEIENSANIKEKQDDLSVDQSAPPISSSPQNLNNTKDIKNEPAEILENIEDTISATAEQPMSSETEAEILPAALQSDGTDTVSQTFHNKAKEVIATTQENLNNAEKNSSAANVNIKEEPCREEIDYGMPIAKTPMHTSSAESFQVDMDVLGNQNENTSNSSLEMVASKSALNEYLDGMVTPIAPSLSRLRVKPALALLKQPQSQALPENNDINEGSKNVETEMCPPPPPPILSSNSNSDFIADGVATPRISLTSINRLRVKTEFCLPPPPASEAPSEALFNDIINTENLEREPGEVSPSVTDDASENELIPNDYFDDLLIDKLKEKINHAQNDDLEIKYSDRLKELERLKSELKRVQEKKERKNRKKQKKSKKKSRKRSRSRSLSPHIRTKERKGDNFPNQSYDRKNRECMSPLREEQYSSSNYSSRQVAAENVLKVTSGYLDIKLEHPANELDNFSKGSPPSMEDVEEVLTPKERKERAIERATALLSYLKDKSSENSSVFYEFPFVSTVRKLPNSLSYVQQQIYENRSPLHTVNNVQYKFNSYNFRFNMEEWGLATMSPIAAKMAKLVGCDAQFVYNKLKTLKIPAKLKKIKQEPNNLAEDEEEELVETTSSLYSNAMTQTDDLSEFDMQRKEKSYEIGVQAEPEVYSIGCQTFDIQSPAKDIHKNDELPIIKLMEGLNENQLMAIHSFAELIKEQTASSNAMEMYKIQMKIMEIYKISQIPSALDTAQQQQPPIVNNYATIARPREQSQLCIQSVKSADGRQFTVNDPRNKSQRLAYDEADAASLRHYHRYPYTNQAAVRPSTSKGYSQTYFNVPNEYDGRHSSNSQASRHHPNVVHNSQTPPSTAKHYGRGGMRR